MPFCPLEGVQIEEIMYGSAKRVSFKVHYLLHSEPILHLFA